MITKVKLSCITNNQFALTEKSDASVVWKNMAGQIKGEGINP